jgi:hypothetical protein
MISDNICEKKLTFKTLFLKLRNNGPLLLQNINSRNYLLDFIIQNYGSNNWDTNYIKKIKTEILNFSRSLTKKWSGCNRTLNIFMNKYKEWLETEFKFPDIKNNQILKSVGRPSKEFSDLKIEQRVKELKSSLMAKLHHLEDLEDDEEFNETEDETDEYLLIKNNMYTY